MRVGISALTLLLLVPRSAAAFFEIASDGSVGARGAKVIVEDDGPGTRWTLAVELEGKATQVGLILLLPAGLKSQEIALPSKLVELERQTAPVIKVVEPADPCTPPGPERVSARLVESPFAPATSAFSIEPLSPKNKDELTAWLASKRIKLDNAALELAVSHANAGGALVGVAGSWSRKPGPAWLPPIIVSFGQPAHTLPLGIAAPFAPVGRTLRVSLYTIASGAPALVPRELRVSDLATAINIPEIAVDVAPDLIRLFSDQVARRERVEVAVRIATIKTPSPQGPVHAISRYELQLGRRATDMVLTLADDPGVLVFNVEWWSRPPFRKPIPCAMAERYKYNARLQLQSELRTYATITGRSLPDVVIESERKGYSVPK